MFDLDKEVDRLNGVKTMAIYKTVFPVVVYVEAQNVDEAKINGADKAGFEYFTTYNYTDCISAYIVNTMKKCPICNFYIIRKDENMCFECRIKT